MSNSTYGDKHREAGMDQFGFEQLAAWLDQRVSLSVGALFFLLRGPTSGRRASGRVRSQSHHAAARAGIRRRFAPHQVRATRTR
jgi:hypothetical protein